MLPPCARLLETDLHLLAEALDVGRPPLPLRCGNVKAPPLDGLEKCVHDPKGSRETGSRDTDVEASLPPVGPQDAALVRLLGAQHLARLVDKQMCPAEACGDMDLVLLLGFAGNMRFDLGTWLGPRWPLLYARDGRYPRGQRWQIWALRRVAMLLPGP